MRVLFWYCDQFDWIPAQKTLPDAPPAAAANNKKCIVAFIQVESQDVDSSSSAETKLVKNAKWLARKWTLKKIVLHSFNHLGESKAPPDAAKALMDRAADRLNAAGYETTQSPYGYFNDLVIRAPGHPLARIYKQF